LLDFPQSAIFAAGDAAAPEHVMRALL